MENRFKAARRASVPLIAIRTADEGATVERLRAVLAQSATAAETPLIRWDVLSGWAAVNDAAQSALAVALGDAPHSVTINPVESLILAGKLPGLTRPDNQLPIPGAVLVLANRHRFSGEPETVQGLLNLRDSFKRSLRAIVMLGPDFTFPAEIAPHVLVIDQPLPEPTELAEIVSAITSQKKLNLSTTETARAVEALRGLAAFPAEQAIAMCSNGGSGVDFDGLWEWKRQAVAATPGLSVWRGGETFDGIGGCSQIKSFLARILTGQRRPLAIVHLDEAEKGLAGATRNTGDSSGVAQGFLGELLQEMQDNDYTGALLVGVAGGGKSAVAKAAGSVTGIPTIRLSLAGLKGSLVGQSEQNLRQALRVIKSVSGGQALFVATSNDVSQLPAEFRSRFTLGTWFFDLPDRAEGQKLWEIYLPQFGLKGKPYKVTPDWLDRSLGWTGREVRQACDIAARTGLPLTETEQYIVPVRRVDAERIELLRRQAANGFLSAAQPGIYQMPRTLTPTALAVGQRETVEF